jgi:hypothetical protein
VHVIGPKKSCNKDSGPQIKIIAAAAAVLVVIILVVIAWWRCTRPRHDPDPYNAAAYHHDEDFDTEAHHPGDQVATHQPQYGSGQDGRNGQSAAAMGGGDNALRERPVEQPNRTPYRNGSSRGSASGVPSAYTGTASGRGGGHDNGDVWTDHREQRGSATASRATATRASASRTTSGTAANASGPGADLQVSSVPSRTSSPGAKSSRSRKSNKSRDNLQSSVPEALPREQGSDEEDDDRDGVGGPTMFDGTPCCARMEPNAHAIRIEPASAVGQPRSCCEVVAMTLIFKMQSASNGHLR